MRDVRVEIDRVQQLLLLDVFAVGVGDMNRARTDEQRPSPTGECGNVGGESRDHGFDAGTVPSSI